MKELEFKQKIRASRCTFICQLSLVLGKSRKSFSDITLVDLPDNDKLSTVYRINEITFVKEILKELADALKLKRFGRALGKTIKESTIVAARQAFSPNAYIDFIATIWDKDELSFKESFRTLEVPLGFSLSISRSCRPFGSLLDPELRSTDRARKRSGMARA